MLETSLRNSSKQSDILTCRSCSSKLMMTVFRLNALLAAASFLNIDRNCLPGKEPVRIAYRRFANLIYTSAPEF